MHLVVAVHGWDIDKFIGYLKTLSNKYQSSERHRGGNLKVREFKLFDMIIPEKISEDIIKDLMFFNNTKLSRATRLISKLIHLLPGDGEKILEPFDINKYMEKFGKRGGKTPKDMVKETGGWCGSDGENTKLAILGTMSDYRYSPAHGEEKEAL